MAPAPEKQHSNGSWLVTEFVLEGFSNLPELRPTLFALFLLTYLVTLSGNATIITIIQVDRTLHTPMYRFLATCLIFSSPFCGTGRVEHFFCDIAPVLKLSCAESSGKALAIFFLSILVVLVSFLLILLSYAFIVAAIVRIPSAAGRRKAFSTCAAHLTVVIVHFGCASIIYLRPDSGANPSQDRLVAVFYTVVTPLLNPVVYTLRNKEVRVALKKSLGRGGGGFK
nr:olfactory receptor 10R2-like [Meriones unguiculatus]